LLVEEAHIKGPASQLYDEKFLSLKLKAIMFTARKQSNVDCLKGLKAHAFGDHCMRHAQAV